MSDERVDAPAHFAAGVIHELRDEPDRAAAEYYLSAQADPSNEDLVIEVSHQLLQKEEVAKALDLLARSAVREGATGLLTAWYGAALDQAGRTNEAVKTYHKALAKDPRVFLAYRGLAQIPLRRGATNEALRVLDQAGAVSAPGDAFWIDLADFAAAATRGKLLPVEETKPRVVKWLDQVGGTADLDPTAYQRMAEACRAVGEPARAAAIYERLLEKHPPRNPVMEIALREQLFRTYVALGDKARAERQLRDILEKNPSNPRVHLLLGSLAIEEKRLPEAVSHLEKAILLDPDLEPAYYDLAGVRLSQNDPAGALEVLDRARAKFKPSFFVEFYSGLAHSARKQYAPALKAFIAAEAIATVGETNRLNHVFYAQMGNAHGQLGLLATVGDRPNEAAGHYAEMDRLFGRALAVSHESAEVRFQVGAAYERLAVSASERGRTAEAERFYAAAEEHLRLSLKLDPEDAEALNYLGYMWADRGVNLEEARGLIEKALVKEPDSGAYLDSLAWVLFKLKRPAEALPPMLKAIERIGKPDPTLLDHLGDIYQALDRPTEARDAWRRALELGPDERIRKKLEPAEPPGAR